MPLQINIIQASENVKRILLVYPPWARNAEPPLGLAMIQGDLQNRADETGRPLATKILDLNALAAWRIAESAVEDGTHRTHRSLLHRNSTLRNLSSPDGFRSHAVYRQVMQSYADILNSYSHKRLYSLTPGDFVDHRFPDYKPAAIRGMARTFENPLLFAIMPDMETELREFAPDTLGISIAFRTQLTPGLALAGWLLRSFPGIRIIIGGSFLSCLTSESLDTIRSEGISVCPGQGETFFRSISGLEDDVEYSGFAETNFSGIDFSRYFAPHRTIPMISSRGCYWGRCNFCDECRESFNFNKPEQLFERIESVIRTYNPVHIHFTDHAIPPASLREITKKLDPWSWSGFVRPTPDLADEDFIDSLAASRCRMLQIGFEARDPDLLKSMNKGVDPEHYPKIIETCQRAGIRIFSYMMFGYPGQTIEHCERSLEFLEKTPPDFINASIFRLPPGAPLADGSSGALRKSPKVRANGRLYVDSERESVSLPDLRRWLSGRFYSSRIIREIIKNTPHFYKSNHAVYF